MKDLEGVDRSQPVKKVKVDPERMSASISMTAGCNCKKTRCLKLYC